MLGFAPLSLTYDFAFAVGAAEYPRKIKDSKGRAPARNPPQLPATIRMFL